MARKYFRPANSTVMLPLRFWEVVEGDAAGVCGLNRGAKVARRRCLEEVNSGLRPPMQYCPQCFSVQNVKLVLESFPSENVFISFMEERRHDPVTFWSELAEFIGLPPFPEDVDLSSQMSGIAQNKGVRGPKTSLRLPEQAQARELIESLYERERRELVRIVAARGRYIPPKLQKFLED